MGIKEKIASWLMPALQKREMQQTLFGNSSTFGAFGYDDIDEMSERQQRMGYRGIFFRCLQIRANAIAQNMLEMEVQRNVAGEWEEVESDHPWYELIRNPSEVIDAYNFWKWVSLARDLGSGAHSFVDYSGVVPSNLYPIYRDFGEINPIPNRFGGVRAWKHIRNDGSIQEYEHNQVLRFAHQSPFSPYESVSLLQAGLIEIDTDRFMKLYRKDSVDEGGLTSVVLKSDQDLSPQQVNKYGSEFKRKMGRSGKREIAVLGAGLAVDNYAMSSKELEYVEGGKLTQSEIFQITGVPQGLFENISTKATGQTAERVFAQYTVQPNLNDLASQLTRALLRIFNASGLRVKAPDAVPLDEDVELKKSMEYIKHGVVKPDEVRIEAGYDSDESVNQFFVSNLQPLRQTQTTEATETEEEDPIQEPERQVRSMKDMTNDEFWRKIDSQKQELEEEQMSVIERMYGKFRTESINNLNKANSGRADEFMVMPDEIITVSQMMEIISAMLEPEIAKLLRAGYDNAKAVIGSDSLFSQSNPAVRDSIRATLKNHFKIAETNHSKLSNVVNELVGQKASFQQIVDAVTEFYPQEFKARGRTTAQTLTTNSYESGQQLLYEQEGVEFEAWVSQRDGRVRDTHLNADGQEIKVSDSFDVGGAKLRYPGDPTGPSKEVIGCRCTVRPIIRD